MVIFERLAALLLPVGATGDRTSVVETTNWRVDSGAIGDLEAVVWGRPPFGSGTPSTVATRSALARAVALTRLRLRAPGRLRLIRVHRWPPPELTTQRWKRAAKKVFLSGALAELSARASDERVLDVVWRSAGQRGHPGPLSPSSGGSARLEARADGARAFLRVGGAGTGADPSGAASGLRLLEGGGIEATPRILGAGTVAGAAWVLESVLPGTRPARMDGRLLEQLVEFCSELPSSDELPRALVDDLRTIAEFLPSMADRINGIGGGCREVVSDLFSILRHGDLWSGNILSDGTRLTGIVDWDACHVWGVPGSDLLNAFSTEFSGSRGSLGDRWLRRPWVSAEFLSLTGPYFTRLGIQPVPEVLGVIAVAWWANQVAASLTRLPHLVDNSQWITSNVVRVVESLESSSSPASLG
ncbi:MAG: aminoglycoside phosphotransferase family protein [Actinomycetota bacterium]|nr:aminoglycoside phosphotransferase family protein [Actinomycetota bacterium]